MLQQAIELPNHSRLFMLVHDVSRPSINNIPVKEDELGAPITIYGKQTGCRKR